VLADNTRNRNKGKDCICRMKLASGWLHCMVRLLVSTHDNSIVLLERVALDARYNAPFAVLLRNGKIV
jgi:hypothetical protein